MLPALSQLLVTGALENPRSCSRVLKISRTAASTELTSPVNTNAPLNLSINPSRISEALVATSAAMMAPSLGVMVRMPIESWLLVNIRMGSRDHMG